MHREPSAGPQAGDETEPDAHTGPPHLPCVDALVAGTVALMTTWADPCPNCRLDVAAQRSLMARKIVSNLFFLRGHPALSPGLRQVMALAHERWVSVARACEAGPAVGNDSDAAPGALH